MIREEIYNRLTFFDDHKTEYDYDICADDILKLFEKLIDEKIKERPNPIEAGYATGYNNALVDLKEELNKEK